MSKCQEIKMGGGWFIYASVDENGHLAVYVSNNDDSGVIALDADIGGENEWAERFTTQKIEEEYRESMK